ncbi:MAG: hypothetical protein R2710_24195 [Acidimicrobiales bacterium]
MSGTRRRWWPSLAAISIVACFGLYRWAWNDAQRAFADVRVVADATPLQCSGIEPGYVEQDIDTSSTFSFWRIELRRAMQCTIEFHLQNTGTREVDIDHALIPFGAAQAQGALAVLVEPGSLQPAPAANGLDARFDFALSLRPGERRTFLLTVTFQDGLCYENGSSILFEDYVRIEASRWLFSGRVGVEQVPIAFTGTGDSESCQPTTEG